MRVIEKRNKTAARCAVIIVLCGALSACLTTQNNPSAETATLASTQAAAQSMPDLRNEADAAARARDARPRIVTYDGVSDEDRLSSPEQGILETDLRSAGLDLEPLPAADSGNPWLPR